MEASKLSSQRETEVRYLSGEIEREYSDWRSASGSNRAMSGAWIGKTIFTLREKEVPKI